VRPRFRRVVACRPRKERRAESPTQRWRLEYYLQCCGFLAEYYGADFVTTQRRDFRFTIDLRGIGKLLDFKGGYEE